MSSCILQRKRSIFAMPYIPTMKYEKFVNKKWVEQEDLFQSKKTFIECTDALWKSMNDEEIAAFMSVPAAPKKNQISFFFKSLGKKSQMLLCLIPPA